MAGDGTTRRLQRQRFEAPGNDEVAPADIPGAGARQRPGDNGSASKGAGRSAASGTDLKRAGDEQLQDVLLDAAITCILERGFYRASSNEIARQAEVTWGAIQYHFGTREELLLAVLERGFARFVASLERAQPPAEATTRDRVAWLARLVQAYYGRPEYVAIMQINLNLSRDPKRAQATEDAMMRLSDGLSAGWRSLLVRTFGPELRAQALDTFIFEVLRGRALAEAVSREGPQRVASRLSKETIQANQDRLIDMLTEQVDRCLR